MNVITLIIISFIFMIINSFISSAIGIILFNDKTIAGLFFIVFNIIYCIIIYRGMSYKICKNCEFYCKKEKSCENEIFEYDDGKLAEKIKLNKNRIIFYKGYTHCGCNIIYPENFGCINWRKKNNIIK